MRSIKVFTWSAHVRFPRQLIEGKREWIQSTFELTCELARVLDFVFIAQILFDV